MTQSFTEEPTTPLEIRLAEELEQVRAGARNAAAQYEESIGLLREKLVRLEELDQITAERNTALAQLGDLQQERDRLYGVLQDTVQGVQHWVPDLTPVPQPPPEIDPALREAWVRDQIAARRADWDTFVHRVVGQASA